MVIVCRADRFVVRIKCECDGDGDEGLFSGMLVSLLFRSRIVNWFGYHRLAGRNIFN